MKVNFENSWVPHPGLNQGPPTQQAGVLNHCTTQLLVCKFLSNSITEISSGKVVIHCSNWFRKMQLPWNAIKLNWVILKFLHVLWCKLYCFVFLWSIHLFLLSCTCFRLLLLPLRGYERSVWSTDLLCEYVITRVLPKKVTKRLLVLSYVHEYSCSFDVDYHRCIQHKLDNIQLKKDATNNCQTEIGWLRQTETNC